MSVALCKDCETYNTERWSSPALGKCMEPEYNDRDYVLGVLNRETAKFATTVRTCTLNNTPVCPKFKQKVIPPPVAKKRWYYLWLR